MVPEGINLQWPLCLPGRMQPSVRWQASAGAEVRLGFLAENSAAVPPPLLPPLLPLLMLATGPFVAWPRKTAFSAAGGERPAASNFKAACLDIPPFGCAKLIDGSVMSTIIGSRSGGRRARELRRPLISTAPPPDCGLTAARTLAACLALQDRSLDSAKPT